MKVSPAVIGALSVDAAKDILPYTPQLYLKHGTTQPVRVDPLASGVLVQVDGVKFLVTAAHVLEENGRPLNPEDVGIMIDDIFHILNGHIKYAASGLHDNNEKVDLTIWKLDEEIAVDLAKKYQFLNLDQLDIEHDPVQTTKYLLVGFPATKSKKKPNTKKIRVEPFIFLTCQPKIKLYQKLDFEEHSHLIVKYRKQRIKNFNGTIVTGPDPYGVSGCGLWYLPKLKKDEHGKVISLLVGIVHEWSKDDSVVIATRIHVVTETIRQAFGLNVPASKITKVNLK